MPENTNLQASAMEKFTKLGETEKALMLVFILGYESGKSDKQTA